MRTAFFTALTAAARRDASVMLLTGDLGFMAIEGYRDAVPAQFHNAGVSESHMVGMAAGLAMAGHRVFVYSIVPFVTMRVCEFVRNDLCYPQLPVTIVGVGAGYAYSNQGFSHHATEDVAVMRALPGLTILSPADPAEVEGCVELLARHPGPAYLRLGKAGEPRLHAVTPRIAAGRALEMRAGNEVTLIATGSITSVALDAAAQLDGGGISTAVLSMVSLKPIDEDAIAQAASHSRAIVTVEEHGPIGGLGSAVADVLAGRASHPPLLRFGLPEQLVDRAGTRDHLLTRSGLTAAAIVHAVRQLLRAPR